MAFELADGTWKLTCATRPDERPVCRRVAAGDRRAILEAIERTRRQFGLGEDGGVVSCYEACHEGFWLHRWLESEGVVNRVVDAASIEVNRRARRAKSDRLDGRKLLARLLRYEAGERKVWSVVAVPSVREEDRRQLGRELRALKNDRNRVRNRVGSLLATQGVRVALSKDLLAGLMAVRTWDGAALPPGLVARLRRDWAQIEWLSAQIEALEEERREVIRTSKEPWVEQVRQLLRLKAVGETIAWVYVTELFGWRRFHNRGQVGSIVGLDSTPYQSGGTHQEHGISKAGNSYVRWLAVQLARAWIRYQPDSTVTRWYAQNYARGGKSQRNVGLVAVARRVTIELWRYLETGVVPEGAVVKELPRELNAAA